MKSRSPVRPSDGVGLALAISSMNREADGVLSLDLRSVDGSPLPEWSPGAHIELELAEGIIRHYSLCGRSDDPSCWRIAVLREPASRGGSSFIHEDLRPGHVISAREPRNNFSLHDAECYLFISGGIGITPIIPMVKDVAKRGKAWELFYGGRTRKSMAFIEELADVPGGDVHILPQDEFGLLDLDLLLSNPRDDTLIYCCGPGSLIDAVEQRCEGWPPRALHTERFVPKVVSQRCTDGEFEVQLGRSGKCLPVPADRTLLEVLEDAGYEIDNSCRAGICGTCEIGVQDGIPEHNDDILSDAERESNCIMLPCVSRSKSAVLVVDL